MLLLEYLGLLFLARNIHNRVYHNHATVRNIQTWPLNVCKVYKIIHCCCKQNIFSLLLKSIFSASLNSCSLGGIRFICTHLGGKTLVILWKQLLEELSPCWLLRSSLSLLRWRGRCGRESFSRKTYRVIFFGLPATPCCRGRAAARWSSTWPARYACRRCLRSELAPEGNLVTIPAWQVDYDSDQVQECGIVPSSRCGPTALSRQRTAQIELPWNVICTLHHEDKSNLSAAASDLLLCKVDAAVLKLLADRIWICNHDHDFGFV